MTEGEILTFSIIGGVVIMGLYAINQANSTESPIGQGIATGASNAGTGIEIGTAAVGIGVGGGILTYLVFAALAL